MTSSFRTKGNITVRRRLSRTALLVALALIVSACGASRGKRLDMAGLLRPKPGQSDVGAQGAGTSPDAAAQLSGSIGQGTASAQLGTGRAAASQSRGGSAATAGAARPGGPAGPSVTANAVTLGFQLADPQQDAYLTALGVKGVTTGDEKGETEAVIAYVNARGGLAGHKIVPVYRYYATNSETFSQMYQEACSAFTQDNKVFAAISTAEFQQQDVLATCLARADALLVFQNRLVWDQREFSAYAPYVYSPSYLRGDRYGVLIDGLRAAGYFDPGARVGILYLDAPPVHRTKDQVVKPRLASYGVPVVAEASMPAYDSVAGISDAGAAMSSAVLQFRTQNVTHVIFVGTNGTAPFLFLPQAESQGYRPRYAFNSSEIPQIETGNAPKAQLHRALGVGWWPTYDVDYPQDPGGNPSAALCASIYQSAGVKFTSRFAYNDAIDICDSLLFLKAGLDHSPSFTARGLRSAVDGLASSYDSPMTFSTTFGPDRFDGASAVRPEAFDDSCTCWKYISGTIPAP